MEKVVIKMVKNNYYQTEQDIKKLIRYIAAEGRNAESELLLCKNGKGVSVKANKAANQMIAVQKALKKDNGRRVYHIVVSFPKNIREKGLIQNSAEDIAEMFFKKYQVYYGIHVSRENWHIHFAVNAVSYITGNKWHQNKRELSDMKEKIYDLIMAEKSYNSHF